MTISTALKRDIYEVLGADFERPENRYLNTPLVRLITSGKLPREALKDYALLRWPFQARADLAMMISHVGFLQGNDAEHLLENAFDEILRPSGEGDHPGLWVQFCIRLGATKEELRQAADHPLAEVAGFPLTMTYYCRRSAEEGLASWFADEEQLPEVHGATALALRKYYGYDDETIEYFLEHVRADIVHSDANEDLLSRYCDTELKVARARRAAVATLWAWREMHQGIHREICRRYPEVPAP
ncbi:MAG: iron-containing redox enzyme family protein [Acidimicrobiales bacterium]